MSFNVMFSDYFHVMLGDYLRPFQSCNIQSCNQVCACVCARWLLGFLAPDYRWEHREHTILLNRKRVNKGMKRLNSLPLPAVVLTRPYCRENRYLQVLRSTVAQNSYLGFSALRKFFFFALHMKFDKGGHSLLKHYERNPNIRSNL